VSVDRRNQPAGRRWFDVFAKKDRKMNQTESWPMFVGGGAGLVAHEPRGLSSFLPSATRQINSTLQMAKKEKKKNSSLQADRQFSKHWSFLGSASPCPRYTNNWSINPGHQKLVISSRDGGGTNAPKRDQ
jgi:hypothetical protein